MSSTVYPVHGGLEDWAYAAGWDNIEEESTLAKCEPMTYRLEDEFNSMSYKD